jgi:alpha-tubulin suppressor-like RCC1 family protein
LVFVFLLSISRTTAQIQTDPVAAYMAIVAQAQALAALEPVTNQFIPALNTNPPPPDLIGTYYSLQQPNSPPLPYPQFVGLPTFLIDATNRIWLVDDLSVDYQGVANEVAQMGQDGETIFATTPQTYNSAVPNFFEPATNGCGTGGAVYITNFSAALASNGSMTVQFDIQGGRSNVVYDILIATNLNGSTLQWLWIGQGLTCNTYIFENQPKVQALYCLGKPSTSTVIAWGDDREGQCEVPPNLTNVVQVAGGYEFSLALTADGHVLAWGNDDFGQTEVPAGLSNVVAIAAGTYHALALKADGTVTAWGQWQYFPEYEDATVPTGLSSVVSISAAWDHDLALLSNGQIVSWGFTNDINNSVPNNLPPAMAVAAAWNHNVALLNNGSVVAWGIDGDNITPPYHLTDVPSDLTNPNAVTGIAAEALHSLALRTDGSVESWGYDESGQTNVPLGLSNVISVSAGEQHSLALKRDGTLSIWGEFDASDSGSGSLAAFVPQGFSNVVAIASGGNHCLAIANGNVAPLIERQPVGTVQLPGDSIILSVFGLGSGILSYQWQFDGTNIFGATNSVLSLPDLQSNQFGFYDVVLSSLYGSVTSSNADVAQLAAPAITYSSPQAPSTNWVTGNQTTLSISANGGSGQYPISYQWQFNGTNIPGATSPSYTIVWTNSSVLEGNYSVIASDAAGSTLVGPWQMHFIIQGNVYGWGDDSLGQIDCPPGVNIAIPSAGIQSGDIIAIAAGYYHGVAVQENGNVAQWGYKWANIPADLTNAVAVAAGYEHNIALRSDGTVTTWGLTIPGNTPPPTNSGFAAVAAGWEHNVGLLTNGQVVAWGDDESGLGWGLTEVPPDATNITAISAQALHSVALKSDGTVVAWGYNDYGEGAAPDGLSNVVAVAAGGWHNLALKTDGTVFAWGYDGEGQCDVPAGLSNVMAVAAGMMHSVALKNDGTVVAWGNNQKGQTNVVSGISKARMIAAGGNFTLASEFSPVVMYQLDVSKELLLIYNTNSQDSLTVLNYYLQHRPMVANANVLGIGYTNWTHSDLGSPCTTNVFYTNYLEGISPDGLTNLILTPIQNWLAANPTKRPGYMILMLDVPSRMATTNWLYFPTCGNYPFGSPGCDYPSVQASIANYFQPAWQPVITSINMDGTNDCIAYVNKLAHFGAQYSPGKLFIRANAGGYDDTNYYFDDTGAYQFGYYPGSFAKSAMIENGVSPNNIIYANIDPDIGLADHLTNGTNVAGYISFGGHSTLGHLFAIDGTVSFKGQSSWYLIQTIESFNGERVEDPYFSNFLQWFSAGAFGGTNYSNTPVGAVCTVDEPSAGNAANPAGPMFGLWSVGAPFGYAGANSIAGEGQAVGDPFVIR